MYITALEFKGRLMKRLPMLTRKQVDYYYKSVIEVLSERFLSNQPVVIDNFGALSRKKTKPKMIFNIGTGKHQEIVSNTVVLRVSRFFLAFFRDKKNRIKIKKKIREDSKNILEEMKDKKKKSLI